MQASTINMAQALLDHGRELWEQDRYEEANRVLSRLLALRELPNSVAERAQFYLGDMQLAQGHYSKARRHLAAAIGGGGGAGETHFLMACALEWDDEADVRAAYRHYRLAVQLEPGQPLYSSAYALMRIRRRPAGSKFDREALNRLREAFTALPNDADIVYNYAYGLIEMGRAGEANIALRRARKQWPDHPAFERLWYDFLADRQPVEEPAKQDELPLAEKPVVADPIILKFPVAAAVSPARQLRPRSRLKTALNQVASRELRRIAENLTVGNQDDTEQLRSDIAARLQNPAQLSSIVSRLSVGGRHLVRRIIDSGGTLDVKQLHLRIDGPSGRQGPHWAKRRSVRQPLEELREYGLAYLATGDPAEAAAEVIMIPVDLRRTLRTVLQQAH